MPSLKRKPGAPPKKRQLTHLDVVRVACAFCSAAPGHRCVGHSGQPRSSFHVDRWVAAREVRYSALQK